MNRLFLVFSGIAKPVSVEQPELIAVVLGFVQQFVPEFTAAEVIWVRSMKTSKLGVLNTQCRSVVMASKVRSTFASLVKAKPVPAFIGKVLLYCNRLNNAWIMILSRSIQCSFEYIELQVISLNFQYISDSVLLSNEVPMNCV